MIDLNNLEEIKKLDPKNVYASTELVLEQCSQIWGTTKSLSFPNEYSNIRNVVVSGMGGSGLGAQVVYHLFKDKLSIPFYINNDYNLPAFADENSLVLLSSYSGTTEETLSSAQEALEKRCKVTGITTGGKLGEILEDNKLSYIKIDPKNNPAGQPRLGTGYSTFGILRILSMTNVLDLSNSAAINAINTAKSNRENAKQKAQNLTANLKDAIPIIFASEFLVGNAHIIRNQLNETAKSFSAYSPLPELNHHLMEGLKNPKNKNLSVLFLNSNLFSEKVKKRIELTKDVVSKNDIPHFEYNALGETKLSQALEVLSFGGYLTFYLALLYGQDPSLTPWVDYFKNELAKP